jgi:hypothetical protein
MNPRLDIVALRDFGLSEATDPEVLAWAAKESRIVLTHDRRTMPRYAWERVARGEIMPGLFIVKTPPDVSAVVEDLLIITEATQAEEWEGKVEYLPY